MKLGSIFGYVGLALGLIMLALGFYLWTPDKKRADLEASYLLPTDKLVTLLGTRIRVRDTGPKASKLTPVILIHGFGSSLETWDAWANNLGQDRRIIRFDLPGSGLSYPDAENDYRDTRALALIIALMDVNGVDRADIIGNSIGGRIAWRFAGAHPNRVRRLVLVSPDGFASPGFAYGTPPQVPFLLSALQWTLPKAMLKANLDPSYGDPSKLSDAVLTRYYDLMLAPGSRTALLDRMKQTVLVDPAAILPKITAPTLLLWGEKDALIPIANAQDYLRLMPNAQLVTLGGLGHVPFEEAPSVSIKPLRSFLDGT